MGREVKRSERYMEVLVLLVARDLQLESIDFFSVFSILDLVCSHPGISFTAQRLSRYILPLLRHPVLVEVSRCQRLTLFE